MSKDDFSVKIIRWQQQYGRHDLPWQKNKTAYRVWISEIMLQQTQVSTVIPYYQKFMRSFPSLSQLANASEDAVLAHWTGLGYYARARNIHKTAQIIHSKHKGHFPGDIDGLVSLPGIGRSTAGAILSFAKNMPTTILDGNVKRILTRYFAIEGWYGRSAVLKKLWAAAESLTPMEQTARYNQAIMDLGATLCTRSKPKCKLCPLTEDCKAFIMDATAQFPHPKPKKEYPSKATNMLLIQNGGSMVLLEKRPSKGIWGGLWCLPECHPDLDIEQYCHDTLHLEAKVMHEIPDAIQHKFTHFQLNINVIYLNIINKPSQSDVAMTNKVWYKLNSELPGGTSAVTLKILQQLKLKEQAYG